MLTPNFRRADWRKSEKQNLFATNVSAAQKYAIFRGTKKGRTLVFSQS